MDNKPEKEHLIRYEDNDRNGAESPQKQKKKQTVSMAVIAATVALLLLLSIAGYLTNGKKDVEKADTDFRREDRGEMRNAVSATGTTTIGMDAVAFEIDFLEETALYVEKVYVKSGDEVSAGNRILKFTQKSLEEARQELEETLQSAVLSYESSMIANQESRITKKYEYDKTMLEAEQAQGVYEDTTAALETELAEALEKYQEAQTAYEKLNAQITGNTFYDDYEVGEKKQAYEEAKELYNERYAYWEVTEDELSTGTSSENQNVVETGAAMPQNMGNRMNTEEQAVQQDRKWIVKTIQLLSEEVETTEEAYEQAEKDYEKAVENAQLNLKVLANDLEKAKNEYQETELKYQKDMLTAKNVYEETMAKSRIAETEYEAEIETLEEELEKCKDARDEAQENLAVFESLIGDGCLYAEEDGSILKVFAQEKEELSGSSMIMAYSKPQEISVTVSVEQKDIAQIAVNDGVQIYIDGHDTYEGVVSYVNPIASSDSKTSVTYTVLISVSGDVSGLSENLTATVMFGETEQKMQEMPMAENTGGESRKAEQENANREKKQSEQENLQNGVTESGTVSMGLTTQEYDLDVSTEAEDDEDEEEEMKYLQVEEVYAAVGQVIKEGDPIYRFSQDSMAAVRKALTYEQTEARIALSQARSEMEVGTIEAGLDKDNTELSYALAQQDYDVTVAQINQASNERVLKIEQLLSEIVETQYDLVEDDYREEMHDLLETYEDAQEDYEEIMSDDSYAFTRQLEVIETLNRAKESYEQFMESYQTSHDEIDEKLKEIAEIQQEIMVQNQLVEKTLLASRQTLESTNISGSIAEQKYQNSLKNYKNAVAKAETALKQATEKLEAFEAFIGDGTVYAKGNGMITELGYEKGDYLIESGILISYASEENKTVSVDVSEEDIVTIHVGDKVNLTFTAYPDETYEGIVTSVTTTATSRNTVTVSYPVEISIQGDTSKIYGGMTADVTFITEKQEGDTENEADS